MIARGFLPIALALCQSGLSPHSWGRFLILMGQAAGPHAENSMRSLHELPAFRDRWSYMYLEYGTLDQTAQGLTFRNRIVVTNIPINQLSLVMLGPGTTITHAAIKALAGNNCLLAWTGTDGVKL
jgi:hypothetical protein